MEDISDKQTPGTQAAHIESKRNGGYRMLYCTSWDDEKQGGDKKQSGGKRKKRITQKKLHRKKHYKKRTHKKRHYKKRTRRNNTRRNNTRRKREAGNNKSTKLARLRGVNILKTIRENPVWHTRVNKSGPEDILKQHAKRVGRRRH